MILVDRELVPEPSELGALRRANAKLTSSQAEPFRVDPALSATPILLALTKLFQNKCAFCESRMLGVSEGNVAHYRPAEGALGLAGVFAPTHYRWLAYEWSNLYVACMECKRFKGHRFPIAGPLAEFGAGPPKLMMEKPYLLDPCGAADPAAHLIFSEDGKVFSETPQGRMTIDILSLNRSSLVLARKERAEEVLHTFRGNLDELTAESSPERLERVRSRLERAVAADRSYTALRRQIAARWLERRAGKIRNTEVLPSILRPSAIPKAPGAKITSVQHGYELYEKQLESYSVAAKSKSYYSKARYIEKIEIENFRIIQNLELDFIAPDTERAHWMMLLGENGSGKSTVLQAIALTLMDARYREKLGLSPATQIRHSLRRRVVQPTSARIRIFLSGNDVPIVLTITRRGFHSNDSQPKALLLGYGATRLLPRRGVRPERGTKFARVGNLFNPFLPLGRPNEWFLRQTADQFKAAAQVVRALLGLPEDAKLRKREGELLIEYGEARNALSQLSDGYQSILALAADIMEVMFAKWPDMKLAEGVVLLDELESHLHPSWKMRIVTQLRVCFPRIQFITTTHDPLCLRGLEKGEVVIMRRDQQQGIFVEKDLPDVKGLPVDQLLTSELFGLNSTLDPEVEESFREYYKLLVKPKLSPSELARRDELQVVIASRQLLGANERERLMLQAADDYLAKARLHPSAKPLRDDVKKHIAALWNPETAPGGAV